MGTNAVYIGDFKKGVFEGNGQMQWPSGEEKEAVLFEGNWKAGEVDAGRGTYYFNNKKDILHGFFKQGQL